MEFIGNIIQFPQAEPENGPRDANGFLVCEHCGGRKEHEVVLCGQTRRVNVMCPCMQAEIESQREAELLSERMQRLARMRKISTADPEDTFDKDDGKEPKVCDIARKYAEKWEELKNKDYGLLFFGPNGTGKSFYANCIANALLDRGVSVLVTGPELIVNKMQKDSFEGDNNGFLEELGCFDLVVFQDLGSERSTPTAKAYVFQAFDARYRAKKPMIITTNYKNSELASGDVEGEFGKYTLENKRVFDRIFERCAPVNVVVPRRYEKMKQNRANMAKELGIEL